MTKCEAERLSAGVNPNNQLQGYDYDAAGNMTRDNNGTKYVYDAENRMSSAPGFTYGYDADGNRVQKTNGVPESPAALMPMAMSQRATAAWDTINEVASSPYN